MISNAVNSHILQLLRFNTAVNKSSYFSLSGIR